MQKVKRLLLLDDKIRIGEILQFKKELRDYPIELVTANAANEGMQLVSNKHFDAILAGFSDPKKNLGFLLAGQKTSYNKRVDLYLLASGEVPDIFSKKLDKQFKGTLRRPLKVADLIATFIPEAKKSGQKKGFTYDPKIVKCFVHAIHQVLEFYLNIKLKIGKPTQKKDSIAKGYATGIISFTGNVASGSMSVTFTKEFLPILAEHIFAGQPIELDDMAISDLTGEMCNQIIGKVKISFAEYGLKITIGLPVVAIGEQHSVRHTANSPVVSIPVKGNKGDDQICCIEFTMKEGVAITEEQGEETKEAPKPDIGIWD